MTYRCARDQSAEVQCISNTLRRDSDTQALLYAQKPSANSLVCSTVGGLAK
jgi:hypothetical protein